MDVLTVLVIGFLSRPSVVFLAFPPGWLPSPLTTSSPPPSGPGFARGYHTHAGPADRVASPAASGMRGQQALDYRAFPQAGDLRLTGGIWG